MAVVKKSTRRMMILSFVFLITHVHSDAVASVVVGFSHVGRKCVNVKFSHVGNSISIITSSLSSIHALFN